MKKQLKKSSLFILAGALTATTIFLAGLYVGQNRISCEVCAPRDVNFSLFWETYNKLKSKYVDPEKISDEEVLYGAISGMTKAIEDPYTVFMRPDNTDKFLEDISGEFEGVGMEVGMRDDVLQVIAPLEGTPADEAGLRAGDKILEVDGESTSGLSVEELVMRIRGEKGSIVTLLVKRDGWEAPREFDIRRERIEIPSLRWQLLNREGKEDAEGTIAYVKLYHFTQKMGIDFAKAAVEIRNSPAERIIVDVRNNPGGYLEMAREIAGYFLERGEVVVVEDSGEEQQEFKSQGTGLFLDWPVVVLINRGSASASEILAGALRANKGVTLIGQQSFGKGSVQELVNLSGGSSLKVTVAKWLTPEGKTIEGEGLTPDREVEITEEDLEKGADPQLQKAVEIVSGL